MEKRRGRGAQGCWNANVVVNPDLGGAAWYHACSHVVFDAALSILATACQSQTVFVLAIILTLWASLDCVYSHAIMAGHHLIVFAAITGVIIMVTDIQEKDKNRSQIGKTEHGNVKRVENQSQEVKVKVNSGKSTVKSDAENKETLNGPPVPI
ncbi:hypothetical protein Tco_1043046 [Tanacetum coccineum]|uniref:Uncharacterized protein n=1 Tax=Tanacetum coccineum TaxID=301880 RepID=A0ABQ5GKW7_9ASTR